MVVALPGEPMHGFRVVQTAADGRAHWTLFELVLRNDGKELRPPDGRQVQATPLPWDAGRAFDGDPFSWWDSGEPMRPGMRLEVEWPHALTVTEAELIYPPHQRALRFAFEAKFADGGWRPLRPEPRAREKPVSREALKRWAGRELRRSGIDFLVTDVAGGEHNVVAPEIAKDPASWGLTEVFRDGTRRLYRTPMLHEADPAAEAGPSSAATAP
jgi:hypothetical protein